jgi:uncharacterized protein YbjT (DUF2867 family)
MANTVDHAVPYLVTGAGGGVGGVSRLVAHLLIAAGAPLRAMVHRDDSRAEALRSIGADVVVGDLTKPVDVAAAMTGVRRMFFSMSVSPDYLEATAVVCAAARELDDGLRVLVNMSQMTVGQMTTSTAESRQQRLQWLAEHVINWSGIPTVHIRPTVFLDNPLFTALAARSIAENDILALPFGTGRTSPIAASDVAAVVATILQNPDEHIGHVYELTGPTTLSIDELAEQYSRGLGRRIDGVSMPYADWVEQVLIPAGLSPHVQQHIATMARLHRDDRYNRFTDDVVRITGRPPQSVEQYITDHTDLFSRAPRPPDSANGPDRGRT